MPDLPDIEEIVTGFSNGISQNTKIWLPSSGRMMRGLEIYRDTDSATLKPQPIKDSGATVTDLVKWIEDAYPYEQPAVRYAYGDSGNIYRIASNTWSLDHTIGSGSPAGQGLTVLTDTLWYSTSTTLGRKFTLSSGTGTYNDDFFSDGVQNKDIDTSTNGNTFNQTYTIPSAISETAVNKFSWTPAFDPLKSISIFIVSKGTGSITVTLHDASNTVLGTVTIPNGSLVNSAFNSFVFATPIRVNIGATYHIHITQPTADGTVQTSTTVDFSTAETQTFFGILIADTNYHPLIQHTNGVTGIFVVGNANYLGIYDNTTYNPNKISLLPGFSVRALMKINDYVAAFCWKGTTIDAYENGYVFYWDGIQPYYNFARPLTEGMPNAVENFKNRLFGIFGSSGNLEIAPDEQQPFRKIQVAPKLSMGSRVEVLPGAMTVWQSQGLFGLSNTNDTNASTYNDPSAGVHNAGDTYTPPTGLEQGIYEFGNQSDRAISYTSVSTEVLNFAWQPSTTIANPLSFKIGVAQAFGQDCYFSYKDGSNFYVDRVNKSNNAVSFGSFESLISDATFNKIQLFKPQPAKMKLGLKIRTTFQILPTGVTVTSKWRLNRASAWTFGKTATAGSFEATAYIGGIAGTRYREMEYGFDVTSTGAYPIISSIGLFYRPLPDEAAGRSI